MENKYINIALIGAGRVAQHYKKIFDSDDVNGFKIIAVCDINQNAADLLSNHWKCRSYYNISTMLCQESPELVIVLTPSGMHFEHAKLVLESGFNVLVEKPVTMLPSDAYKLNEIALERKLMIGVAFQNRLNPAMICLRNAVSSERFGRIISATIRLRWCRYQDYYNDGWHGTWENDGGVVNQQAIHHVDALNWLMGPIESVCATSANRMNSLEAEDTLVAVLRFKNGAIGTIEATTAARPRDFEASLSVVGEKGLVVLGGIALNKVDTWDFVQSVDGDEEIKTRYSQEVPSGYGLSHGPLLQDIINKLLLNQKSAPISVQDAISTTELIHSIYCSIETNGWIQVKDKRISKRLGKKSDNQK